MRILLGVTLLLALGFATGCSSDDKPATLQDAALDASGNATSIIDDVVKDEHRARMAKQGAEQVMMTIANYYANVAAQRKELVKIAGDSEATRADCQPVLDNMKAIRKQFSNRLVDEWLLVRAWMTPDEWVSFNTKLQRKMN
jgi:hypothetical protein